MVPPPIPLSHHQAPDPEQHLLSPPSEFQHPPSFSLEPQANSHYHQPTPQTPQQRKANERYARSEAAKRGKPESAIKKKEKYQPPISKGLIGLLAFVVCGGLLFELLRLFF
ncbi:serine/threonine-protein kinase svkA [Physcia stellaris]|nr:serine/threonine-protein kinase svkA [Physcia stellaris]